MKERIVEFEDGLAICGDALSPDVIEFIAQKTGGIDLVCTDPPYGNVIKATWDRWDGTQRGFVDWMLQWTNAYSRLLLPRAAMYVWGGYGVPSFRPFFEYVTRVESESPLQIANLITWSKRRAYGTNWNYLVTREELLYMVNGPMKKPLTFNVPLLNKKRGYAGFNKKYPAKSEFYRRTNVWTDVNELFRGKVHVTQKPLRVFEIPIEVSTNSGGWVVDIFAGSGVAGHAARKLSRRFILVENDQECFDSMVSRLRA